MKYIVEYIFNEDRDWAVWFHTCSGLKTSPMTGKQFLSMDAERQSGKYIFFSVEVIKGASLKTNSACV